MQDVSSVAMLAQKKKKKTTTLSLGTGAAAPSWVLNVIKHNIKLH